MRRGLHGLRWLPLGVALAACWACKADTSFMDADIEMPARDAGSDPGRAADAQAPDLPARPCDLLAQQGCPGALGSHGCYPDPGRTGATMCSAYPVEASLPGTACIIELEAQSCAPQQICVPPDGVFGGATSGICQQLCVTTITGNSCSLGGACTPIPNYPGVGYCPLF